MKIITYLDLNFDEEIKQPSNDNLGNEIKSTSYGSNSNFKRKKSGDDDFSSTSEAKKINNKKKPEKKKQEEPDKNQKSLNNFFNKK